MNSKLRKLCISLSLYTSRYPSNSFTIAQTLSVTLLNTWDMVTKFLPIKFNHIKQIKLTLFIIKLVLKKGQNSPFVGFIKSFMHSFGLFFYWLSPILVMKLLQASVRIISHIIIFFIFFTNIQLMNSKLV